MPQSRAVKYDTFGPASVLRIESVEVAPPPEGKVRIAVRAAGLNPADYKVRNGWMPQWAPKLPAGIGREVAGVIDAIGDGVDEFAVGDEVFGAVASGGVAEHVRANPAHLARKPTELDWALAASLPTAGQTAWESVESQHLTGEDTVLVSAAAGGVGIIASQLALKTGARVIGTASESNHEFLRSLGVIPVAYGPDLAHRVRALGAVTSVLDNYGVETIEAGLALGVDRARINTIATDPAPYGVAGVGRGSANPSTLEKLARLVVDGKIVVPIFATFALDDVVEAFEVLETGHVRGKVVVVP